MNIIHIRYLLAVPALVLTGGAVSAQDFTAGKTPAQLFSSDCSTCHHVPNGLGKKYDVNALSSFLREHYTTKPDTAGSLAKYVMGFANLRAAAVTPPSADEAARSGDEPRSRRRTSNLSGDGEKPIRPRSQPASLPPANAQANAQPNAQVNEAPPKPVAAAAQPGRAVEAAVQPPAASRNAAPAGGRGSESESSPPVAKLNDYARTGTSTVPPAAADPMSRIRAYATSGAGPQEAAAEAPKPASGKPHRRSDSGAVPAAAAPAVPAPVPAAPAAPANPNAMPPPAPLSAVTPAPGGPAVSSL